MSALLPNRTEPIFIEKPDDATPGAPVRLARKPLPRPVPQTPARRARGHHWGVALSLLLIVFTPTGGAGWYLWERAADQYVSKVGFSVRKEENTSAVGSVLGSLNLSGSRTSDTDVLYQFIQSQQLVAAVNSKLDLRAIWSKANPARDPVFAYHPPGTIEDLLAYWHRMVRISYDSSTGLITLKVLAFDPHDAQAIARQIYIESTAMINNLSAIAREDAIRYARNELKRSVGRLKAAREALTEFRNRTQIVDPTADVQGQMSLLATLQQRLAEALIETDLLRKTTRASDPRITQAELRIRVIRSRIADERRKVGVGRARGAGKNGRAFATLVGKYESLVVDRQFAEQAYTTALAAYDAAQEEARRQSRYLAAYLDPTLAQKSEYPDRPMLLGLIGVFLFLLWSISVLVYFSLKDRR